MPLKTEPSVSEAQTAVRARVHGFIIQHLRWLFDFLPLLAGKLAVNVIKRLLSVSPEAFIFITVVASDKREDGCWN